MGAKARIRTSFREEINPHRTFSNFIIDQKKILCQPQTWRQLTSAENYIVSYWVSLEDHWAHWSLILPEGPQVRQHAATQKFNC